jgi:protein TonB
LHADTLATELRGKRELLDYTFPKYPRQSSGLVQDWLRPVPKYYYASLDGSRKIVMFLADFGQAPIWRRCKDFDMPGTAKDVFSEAGISGDAATIETQGSQASSASGAEIPVTVHASRYSSASKGTGKLPPVHEDTRTVIIFPQGAVVRLSATVTLGELVVLTNSRTGADVICRVTSVKTQPGIQNYVHLEFTQRALDFWEATSSAEPGASTRKPAAVTSPSPAPPVRKPVILGSKTADSPIQQAQPAASPAATVDVKPVPAALPKITPLADAPTPGSHEISAKAQATPAQASEVTPAPTVIHMPPAVVPPASPRFQPFETGVPQKATKSKSIILFAMAAAVLVAMGSVAGPKLWQRYRGVIPGVQNPPAAANLAPLAVPSDAVASDTKAPIVKTSGDANPVEPVARASAKNPPAETPTVQPQPIQPPVEVPKVEVPKTAVQPQHIVRPALNVGKISAPRIKRSAQMNSSEPPPVFSADATASNMISQSLSTAPPQASSLPAPVAPAPPKGGQLQQPKLLSSVAAVYPPPARAKGVQGDVTIDALIDVNGKVSATNVLTGNPLLQRAAVDSLRLWKYQPAKLNGEPIPIHINVTIAFHLK